MTRAQPSDRQLLQRHHESYGDDLVDVGGRWRHEEHSIEQLAASAIFGQGVEIVGGPLVAEPGGHGGPPELTRLHTLTLTV